MILGFAHLTLSSDGDAESVGELARHGWQLRESYRDVPSAPQKWPLLGASERATRHDLYLLTGKPNVEVIVHNTGTQRTAGRLGCDADGTLVIQARNPPIEQEFLKKGLQFVESQPLRMVLSSRFPSWSIALRTERRDDAVLDPPLDVDGYSCIAFYSSDPVGDTVKLGACGGREMTAPFEVQLGERHMQIVMLRSPEGTIIELIKVKVKK